MKEKRLLSSLREKKRYVVFEVKSEDSFSFSNLKDAIALAYKDLFGEMGLAKSGLNFVEFENNKGILRINNKDVKNIKASFVFLRKINKQDAIVRSLGVSGMLKRARLKFLFGGGL